MRFDEDRLYALLPALYRARDAEEGYPLKALIGVIAEQIRVLQEDLDQLYDDQFIETCAQWVVPYIGDLIGYRGVNDLQGTSLPATHKRRLSERAQLANTVAYRRRKGTVAALEQVARDVSGWEANVVEYFRRLATSQHINHIRPETALANLRDWQALENVPTPFNPLPHTADVRRLAGRRAPADRYNMPHFGIFLWRTRAYPVIQSPATATAMERRLRFSPLGQDIALFAKPLSETSIGELATQRHVARPISRIMLHRNFDAYYGAGTSLAVYARERSDQAHRLLSAADIVVCNLKGWSDIHRLPADKFALDPELGRLTLPTNWLSDVRVSFHFGFSGDLGGGVYDRTPSLASSPTTVRVPTEQPGIDTALDTLALATDAQDGITKGLVSIEDSGRYGVAHDLQVGVGRRIIVQAASGQRPMVALDAQQRISGAAGSELVLSGLLITGGPLRVTGGLRRLRLLDCTLVPGLGLTGDGRPLQPGTPSLIVEVPDVEVSIRNCIVGAIRIHERVRVDCRNSVIDATAPDRLALGGLDDATPAGLLGLRNTTLIGQVRTREIDIVSNSLLMAESASRAPIHVIRNQSGCVRYSYLPPDARVPRRFSCQPTGASQAESIRPHFVSLRYGEPGYCQLRASCPQEIFTGADDGAEMGAFHDLYQPQRVSNLEVRLQEHLPLTLEGAIMFAS